MTPTRGPLSGHKAARRLQLKSVARDGCYPLASTPGYLPGRRRDTEVNNVLGNHIEASRNVPYGAPSGSGPKSVQGTVFCGGSSIMSPPKRRVPRTTGGPHS